MSLPPKASLSEYVYRRLAPHEWDMKQVVYPVVFEIAEGMKGLSVYRADIATPHMVLEARLDDARKLLESDDEATREKGASILKKNPDVSALLSKGYRVIAIPIASIKAMGINDDTFSMDGTKGHMNILGSVALFDNLKFSFLELLKTEVAWVLNDKDCLS